MPSKYIIRAIDYVNGVPHMGHTLEMVQSDVFARFYRSQGYDVRLGIGTDEHGQKIEAKAKELGMTPKEMCDVNSEKFREMADKLNISYDHFIRTTDEKHERIAQTIWKKLVDKGDLYKKNYEALYCVGCESFKMEKDLVDGKCPEHDKAPITVQEENYFFKLSKYQQPIANWLRDTPKLIYPEARYNEIRNIVQEGLEDISVSRSKEALRWGIAVPGDDTQVMYVWFEALMNYITAIDYSENNSEFAKWWTDAEILHVIGKDILRHHVAIWPAMLLALDVKLPEQYFVHGFIYTGGQKMSKSIGNVIDPLELIEKYGVDPVRWYLLREITTGKDGDITYERFDEVYTSDLANNLGNLLRRVIVLITKNELEECDADEFISDLEKQGTVFDDALRGYRLHEACEILMEVLNDGNQYIDENAPWKTVKEDPDEAAETLWNLVYLLKWVAKKMEVLLPETAEKLQKQLGSMEVGEVLFGRMEE